MNNDLYLHFYEQHHGLDDIIGSGNTEYGDSPFSFSIDKKTTSISVTFDGYHKESVRDVVEALRLCFL
jgi:hypothetical protein